MRTAIPQWQGRVSPVFDVAGSVLLVDVERGREVRREERLLPRTEPLDRGAELLRCGVEVLICGAISAPVEARLISRGVRVIGFICGTVDEVLGAFLSGELSNRAFAMPGCGRRHRWMGARLGRGPVGLCVCPECGAESSHVAGQPCSRAACSICGTAMRRA